MASGIPKHHLRQKICSTRAPYREGRHGKAVKVYTVNNESCYILVQGVPSVGATQELQKLCASFGQIEQFNPLDDYPCEDKYTEVYLIKYHRIQSARYAKRKLDDHSFFGGSMHVCYAPEYETVNETRAKLQDRRRAVAAKISQHARDAAKQISSVKMDLQLQAMPTQSTAESPTLETSVSNTQLLPLGFGNHPESVETPPNSVTNTGAQIQIYSRNSSENRVPSLSSSNPPENEVPCNMLELKHSTFELPLPPRQDPNAKSQRQKKHKYEFARVPSAHSTLPAGFEGQITSGGSGQSSGSGDKSHHSIGHFSSSGTSTPHSGSKSSLTTAPIIVKNYNPSKLTPRFVPRQAVKTKLSEQSHEIKVVNSKTDSLDQEIRKNAFQLREPQGPAVIPNRKRELTTAAQQSVSETISEIRNKISKVITEGIKKQS